MKTKKEQIIKMYENKELVHPSYGRIAAEVGVSKAYVYQMIKDYLMEKKLATGQFKANSR